MSELIKITCYIYNKKNLLHKIHVTNSIPSMTTIQLVHHLMSTIISCTPSLGGRQAGKVGLIAPQRPSRQFGEPAHV